MHRLLFGTLTDRELLDRARGTHRDWLRMLESMTAFFMDHDPGPAIGPLVSLGRDTLWIRNMGEACAALAMAWRATARRAYLDRALHYLRSACAVTEWGGDLEQGHLLGGVGLTYDWLHEELGEELRASTRSLLLERIETMLHQYQTGSGTGWWRRLYTQNHLWINMAGVAAAAYALRRRDPELGTRCAPWIETVRHAFSVVFSRLPEDGSFHEMGSYYHYGLRSLVTYATLAEEEDGLDLWGHGYLANAAAFMLHTATPSARHYMAYGDTGPLVHGQATIARLAARYRDGAAQWLALKRLTPDARFNEPVADEVRNYTYVLSDRLFECYLGMAWCDASVAPAPPEETARLFPDLGLFASRTGWDDRAAACCIKCGPWGGFTIARQGLTVPAETSLGHSNPDNMSFFYFAKGEEIIADADYEMRCRTSSHNTVMVEDAGQHGDGIMWPLVYDKWPSIVDAAITPRYRYAACDGTDAYARETMLRGARRHFIHAGEVLVIADELESYFANWFRLLFNTYGDVRVDGASATLRCGRATVRLEVLEPAGEVTATLSDRLVIARQGYGHETVEEARGRRVTINLRERRTVARFLTVLRPEEVPVSASWGGAASVRVELADGSFDVPLSRRPGLRPR